MKKTLFGLFLVINSLTACNTAAPQPVQETRILGTATLTVDGSSQPRQLGSRAVLGNNQISLQATYSGYTDTPSPTNQRLIFTTYTFQNLSATNFTNLTFYGRTMPNSLAGTAILSMTSNFNSGDRNLEFNLARSIKPVHGFTSDGISVAVNPNTADVQAISPSERQALDTAAKTALIMNATDSLLEYGFVARNALNGTRIIGPGQTGRVTVALKIPINGSVPKPYIPTNVNLAFVVVDEAITRVTRTVEESPASVVARANAIGATSIAEIGICCSSPNLFLNPQTSIEGVQMLDSVAFGTNTIIASRVFFQPNGQAIPMALDAIDPITNANIWSKEVRSSAIGPHVGLTVSALNPEEGLLSRSADGKCVVFTGYNAPTGQGGVNFSSASLVRRVVGVLYPDGAMNTRTTTQNGYDKAVIGGAASDNCFQFWTAGSAGTGTQSLRYSTLNIDQSIPIAGNSERTRAVKILNSQIYTTMTNSATYRLGKILGASPTFLPTSGILPIENIPVGGVFLVDFEFSDLSPTVPGIDTFYATDQGSAIYKYSLINGVWVSNGSQNGCGVVKALTIFSQQATPNPAVGLAIASGNTLYKLIDTSGYNVPINGTCTVIRTLTQGTYLGVAAAPR
jgi:hypothetical protein